MVDFYFMLYFIIAAVPFFVGGLGICVIWKKPDNAVSKAGKLRKWILRILLVGLVVTMLTMLASPLLGIAAVFYGLPLSAVVLVILCLIRFCQVRIMRKKGSEAVRKEDGKALIMFLILSFAFVVVMFAVFACFIFLPADAIAYM